MSGWTAATRARLVPLYWRVEAATRKRRIAWLTAVTAWVDALEPAFRRVLTPILAVVARGLGYPLLETKWLDEHTDSVVEEVVPSRTALMTLPAEVGSRSSEATECDLPAIRRHLFRDVTIPSVHSSSIVDKGSLVVERAVVVDPGRGVYRAREVPFVGANLSLIRRRKTEHLAGGHYLGGNAAYNYYHFLIEIVPKLAYTEIDEWPLLVSEDVEKIPQFREILDLVRPGAKLASISAARSYRVDELHWVSAPSNTPVNLQPGIEVRPSDFYFDQPSLDHVRDLALAALAARDGVPDGPKRVFLGRRPGRQRAYNQEDILPVVEEFGFTPVFLEDLTFLEQVSMFQTAEFIVGPTGASWSNLLFGRQGARGLYWIASDRAGFSSWSALGGMYGVDVRFITYVRADPTKLDLEPYRLDPDVVREALARWDTGDHGRA